MDKIQLDISTQHLIEVFDKEKNEKKFLMLIDDEWKEINEDKYNTIRGNKNG